MLLRLLLILVVAAATLPAMGASGNYTASSRMAMARHKLAKPWRVSGGMTETCRVFVEVADDQAVEMLEKAGARNICWFAGFVTADIPAEAMPRLADVPGVVSVSAGRRVSPANDKARVLSGIGDVQDTTGLGAQICDGRGVVLGVIDTGVDFNHIDFRDSAGNNRIKGVYLPCVWSGARTAHGTDTLPGSVFEDAESIGRLTTDNTAMSHGTHTLGTAAGSCRANPYYGIAPGAELVVSAMPEDSLTDTNVANSLMYMADYASRKGKPLVVNMSLSSSEGAHDGSSFLCRVIDSLAGKGRIFVVSAGNDGEVPVHIEKKIGGGDTLRTFMCDWLGRKVVIDGDVSAWAADASACKARISIYDSSKDEWVYRTDFFGATDTAIVIDSATDKKFAPFAKGSIAVASAVENGRTHLLVDNDVVTASQNLWVGLEIASEAETGIELWSNHRTYLWGKGKEGWTNGSSSCSISDMATGKSAISVGAYCSKDAVTGVNGTLEYKRSKPFGMAYFSSYGSDANGVARPDVTAPGFALVSSANRYDTESSVTKGELAYEETAGGESYPYGVIYGTSMSAPVVAGGIATWLQIDPELTCEDVRRVMAATCRRDSYVESGDSRRWGMGKIDIAAGQRWLMQSGVNKTLGDQSKIKIWPNPTSGEVWIAGATGMTKMSVYSASGELLLTQELPADASVQKVDLTNRLCGGIYIIDVHGQSRGHGKALLVVKK